jgi:hypothetical protein
MPRPSWVRGDVPWFSILRHLAAVEPLCGFGRRRVPEEEKRSRGVADTHALLLTVFMRMGFPVAQPQQTR